MQSANQDNRNDRLTGMNITILVPCYNEEASVKWCILSCLHQSMRPHQIIFVDDCSTDATPDILAQYADKITIVRTPKNTRNKSSAQEYGLRYVTGDVVITTDADTVLDYHFVEEIAKSFIGPRIAAVCGYVSSMRHNWLTLCRAFEYSIGQNIHKLAQGHLGAIFVIPGAAGAFRTDIFREYLTFDHDTVTEDLDFTYKLHRNGFEIVYNGQAVVHTQDPATLHSYINQMRRWIGGGWQNLVKHSDTITMHPARAFELSLLYVEGLILSSLFFILPVINIRYALIFLFSYFATAIALAVFAAIKERRADILLVPFPYMFLVYINAYVFLEQFFKEAVLRQKNLIWFKPERITT